MYAVMYKEEHAIARKTRKQISLEREQDARLVKISMLEP
jgi:hypothetical protein